MSKLLCALLLCASAALAADVTGTWLIAVETSQGSGTPAVDLKQQGEQLTGTFHSQLFGDAAVKGTVKGDQIEFGFEADAGGMKLKVTYRGTVLSPTSMKGTAVYEGFDDKATWTAAKKQ